MSDRVRRAADDDEALADGDDEPQPSQDADEDHEGGSGTFRDPVSEQLTSPGTASLSTFEPIITHGAINFGDLTHELYGGLENFIANCDPPTSTPRSSSSFPYSPRP